MKFKIRHFFCVLTALVLLVACRTPNLPSSSHNENNSTISVSQDKERDSIYVEVEKIVYRDGDTVYITNTKIEYRDRWRVKVDSFLVEVVVVDSIPYEVPVPVEVEVPKPYVPAWVIWIAVVGVLVVFGNVILLIIKVKRKLGK